MKLCNNTHIKAILIPLAKESKFMSLFENDRFTRKVIVFQGIRLPEQAILAGYSALIDVFALSVPAPRVLFAIADRHRKIETDLWRVLPPRYAPRPTLDGHLTFALKYEGVDLAILKRLFIATGPEPIAALIEATPTGAYARRVWFLYEWLIGQRLNIPDARAGRYVPAIDPRRQWAIAGTNSTRHHVRNNLPGTPAFCPLVFRTQALDRFIGLDLPSRVREIDAVQPRQLMARTTSFLLLKDSRSSYAIEGERPPPDRVQRWGRVIGEAGRHALDLDELLRLQAIVIGDARFLRLGLRHDGGFVGERERDTGGPLPDHICAKPDDLPSLIDGLLAFDTVAADGLEPVIAAAVLAFGFVYIHPFEDGNGRLHRYLMHHVLARTGFAPPGLIFPVSAAILQRIGGYRRVLEIYSRRLLPIIEWRPGADGNVEVMNETADFYRYFDATPHAEFLYDCVLKTIDEDLPDEIAFLQRHDAFRADLQTLVEMPDRRIDLLFRFLQQNNGRLSARARRREFAGMTSEEARQIEAFYRAAFEPAVADC